MSIMRDEHGGSVKRFHVHHEDCRQFDEYAPFKKHGQPLTLHTEVELNPTVVRGPFHKYRTDSANTSCTNPNCRKHIMWRVTLGFNVAGQLVFTQRTAGAKANRACPLSKPATLTITIFGRPPTPPEDDGSYKPLGPFIDAIVDEALQKQVTVDMGRRKVQVEGSEPQSMGEEEPADKFDDKDIHLLRMNFGLLQSRLNNIKNNRLRFLPTSFN